MKIWRDFPIYWSFSLGSDLIGLEPLDLDSRPNFFDFLTFKLLTFDLLLSVFISLDLYTRANIPQCLSFAKQCNFLNLQIVHDLAIFLTNRHPTYALLIKLMLHQQSDFCYPKQANYLTAFQCGLMELNKVSWYMFQHYCYLFYVFIW